MSATFEFLDFKRFTDRINCAESLTKLNFVIVRIKSIEYLGRSGYRPSAQSALLLK